MFLVLKNKIEKIPPLVLAFVLPFFIMLFIFILLKVYPFGDSSLLTVDLGQQYIDFFAAFRQTLLHDPSALFYSFNKAIGGDMMGLWAYYLTSPFNLLLLPFPEKFLTVGVMLLTLVKISSASLSFAYFLKKTFKRNDFGVTAFGISYGLMGYIIVNQLNIMWLDGMVFLPLIALGVEKLIQEKKFVFYSVFLGLTLFANYYMGYMICLFITLYYLMRIFTYPFATGTVFKEKISFIFERSWRFAIASVLGAGTTAMLLFPNIAALVGGKASYTANTLLFKTEYPVWEMLSKFYIGAFNFDQMPSGYPNLFIGSLSLICFILYFFNRYFPMKERLITLLLTIIFVLSMNIQVFDYFWHGLQAPIWYPYRFSFVVSFFMLFIGYRSFLHLKQFKRFDLLIGIVLLSITNYFVLHHNFDFLTMTQIAITTLFILFFFLIIMRKKQLNHWFLLIILFSVTIEMSVNAGLDLDRLSYVKNSRFVQYREALDPTIKQIQAQDDDFYRIEKTFLRSKNDSFQNNYAGITHFSSTFEKEIPALFSDLGFPSSSGFIAYSNATLLTDALFGVKYYLTEAEGINADILRSHLIKEAQAKPEIEVDVLDQTDLLKETVTQNFESDTSVLNKMSTKPDLTFYQPLNQQRNILTYQNPFALPLAFGVDQQLLTDERKFINPILYQNYLLNKMLGQTELFPYFFETNFDSVVYKNVHTGKDQNDITYTKNDTKKEASIDFQLTAKSNNSYYLTLNSNVKAEDIIIYLNGSKFSQYETTNDMIVLNIGANQQDQPILLTIALQKDEILLKDFKLYQLDIPAFKKAIKTLHNEAFQVKSHTNTRIAGSVTIAEDQRVLFTTIPYSTGWKVTIDGKSVSTEKALNSLLAVPIEQGEHQVIFTYTPPLLIPGIFVSVFCIGTLVIVTIMKKRKGEDDEEKNKN
ncbi:YfhO family protein [Isobaculum melis]|uniref:Uncharacterized membrane protein YfhO n=1 Tax=Isobaculum melis TaxID=142588 RepID=A0A1H9RUF6_9LACT|nr:YfhO family protein [Isobaculum melis]SER75743.1 Uncharacterized membrane protein YfhO [Isobaculum melis]